MEQRKGTFYGVSVGPGDPEADDFAGCAAHPAVPGAGCAADCFRQMLALDIARSALGSELDGKTILPL